MATVALLVFLVLAGLCALVAKRLSRARLSWGVSTFGLALVVLAFQAAAAYSPAMEEWLHEWESYPHFRLAPGSLAAVTLLMYLAYRAPRQLLGWLLGLLSALVIVFQGQYLLRFIQAEHWHGALTGQVDETGWCGQTSPYTCGAAAAAMLLKAAGVDTDEQEMARECLVREGVGVTDYTLLRGLRRKLKGTGWRVELRRGLTYRELIDAPKPCLVSLQQGWLLDHVVVVEWADGRLTQYADPDPLMGRRIVDWRFFAREWRGDALVLVKDGGGAEDARQSVPAEGLLEF